MERRADAPVDEDELLRANWYGLLARLLGNPPDDAVLATLGRTLGDETELGRALDALAAVARERSAAEVRQEHFDLFVGVGQPQLLPYGSYYLAGFLHDKPLARLRGDMGRLGVARAGGVHESEDHVASLCEIMAGLAVGAFGAPVPVSEQHDFFAKHLGCWAPRFFADLEKAPDAVFYRPVGTIGRLFMAVESEAFEMAA